MELGVSDKDPAREVAEENHDHQPPQGGGQRCPRHCLASSSVKYQMIHFGIEGALSLHWFAVDVQGGTEKHAISA